MPTFILFIYQIPANVSMDLFPIGFERTYTIATAGLCAKCPIFCAVPCTRKKFKPRPNCPKQHYLVHCAALIGGNVSTVISP